MMVLVGVVVWIVWMGVARGYCPLGCGCDDTTLSVSCLRTDMKVMPISLNPSIESLILRYNQFSSVDASISFYPRLKHLDLARNQISQLQDKIFLSQQNLVNLQLDRNNISTISNLTFSGLKLLQVLNLSTNSLSQLSDNLFSDLNALQTLDLSENKLKRLEKTTFVGLSSLHVLKLNRNLLSFQSETIGSVNSSVDGLELSTSWIKTDKQQINIQGLLHLDLADNLIKSIPDEVFEELVNLKYLNLAGNQLTTIPTSALSLLGHLEELNLSRNLFTILQPDSIRNINLRVLEISSCSTLTRIQGQSFNLLRNLENVTISFNPELEEIEDGVFSSEMSTLVHLDISQNNLKFLYPNTTPWEGLSSLQISGNSWHCDCSALLLRRLIEDQIVKGRSLVRRTLCAEPPELTGTDILSLPDHICQTDQPHSQPTDDRMNLLLYTSTLIFTAIIIIIVIFILAVFFFFFIRRVCREKQFRSTSSTGTEETYCQVRDHVESPTCSATKINRIGDQLILAGDSCNRIIEPILRFPDHGIRPGDAGNRFHRADYPGGIMYFYRDPVPSRPSRSPHSPGDLGPSLLHPPPSYHANYSTHRTLEYRGSGEQGEPGEPGGPGGPGGLGYEDCDQEYRPLTLSYARH